MGHLVLLVSTSEVGTPVKCAIIVNVGCAGSISWMSASSMTSGNRKRLYHADVSAMVTMVVGEWGLGIGG